MRNSSPKELALTLATVPFRLLPPVLRRWLCVLNFRAAAKQPAREGMKRLLEIEDDLTGYVNRVAIEYDGGIHVKHRLTQYHEYFVQRCVPRERVLDIGCGYGAVAYSIASRAGATVVGIDRDPGNVDKARGQFQHPNLTFVNGDVLEELPQGAFDVVLLSNILEHLEHRIQFVAAVQSRLVPKRWLIRVPMINRDWRVPLRRELGLPFFSDRTHYTEYTMESFEEEMRQAGLSVAHLQVNWGEIWAEARPIIAKRPDVSSEGNVANA